jgi:hypothetical protein
MKSNKHMQSIPADVLNKAQSQTDEVRDLFAPYQIELSPAERLEQIKMGKRTINFVQKAYEYASQYPKLIPEYLDMDAFTADYVDAHGLGKLIHSIRRLETTLIDIENSAKSEAFQTALTFYKFIKIAAEEKIPGANEVYRDLKNLYPSSKRKSSVNAPTSTETQDTSLVTGAE